jgi:hypothetical protein
LLRHIPFDRDQRFGPIVFLFPVWALLAGRRDGMLIACCCVLLLQCPVWLLTTHLYARFAVPLLIPLIVLAGCVPLDRRRLVAVLLAVGTMFNLGFATRLYAEHMLPGGTSLDLEGVTAFFTDGHGLGHEHLAVVNGKLPAGACILMVGDAKAFYFRRSVDYCVVFNRSPFVEVVGRSSSAEEVVAWLSGRDYTHVLVNWSEIQRLRNSRYGFPPEVTLDLFKRLTEVGLIRTHTFARDGATVPYAELYEMRPRH